MQDYTFDHQPGAQPAAVKAAVLTSMPAGWRVCEYLADNLLHVIYDDDVAVAASAVDLATEEALAIAPLMADGDTALQSVEATAAAIGADVSKTSVTDARIDALEQRLNEALQKIALLLGA
jgi:hypothetical protein